MRDTARRLTFQYVAASTIILLASGLLGVLIRDSQANFGRIGTNTWYALMTAHGLGAFLGWAGFAVMGFAFWILQEVGLPAPPLRPRDGAPDLVADGGRCRRRSWCRPS